MDGTRNERNSSADVDTGGGGGKMSRRPLRPKPSPYARPPKDDRLQHQQQQQQQTKKASGWFSKLFVQPAARVLPSIFYPARNEAPSTSSEPLTENKQEDFGGRSTLICNFPESEEPGASDEAGHSEGDVLTGNKEGNANSGSELAKIEQRFKHKMFTRDESDRLIELLRSRTVDLPNDNRHGEEIRETAEVISVDLPNDNRHGEEIREAAEVISIHQDPTISMKEDVIDLRIPEIHQLTVHDVSSSPIDIAKAYMESLKSGSVYDCQSERAKNEKQPTSDDNSIFRLSSNLKSPICWPGAVVHGDHGYMTPQTQRGRGGLNKFPRTPYSGSLFSRSTSKFPGGGERPNRSPVGPKQSYTPVYGSISAKRHSSVSDDDFASVIPARHVRQRSMGTPASNAAGPSNPACTSIRSNIPDDSKGISSTIRGNLERGSPMTSYSKLRPTDEDGEVFGFTPRSSSSLHPQSIKMARKIFEHLDRTVYPKEKSLEMQLAASRGKVPPKPGSPFADGQDERGTISPVDPNGGSLLFTGHKDDAKEILDAQKFHSGPSTSKSQDSNQLSSLLPRTTKQASIQSDSRTANFKSIQRPNPPFQFEGSNSAAQTGERLKGSGNGFSFTFPAPPDSTAFTEPPPTPTLFSSPAVDKTCAPTSEEGTPLFNFGSSTAGSRLVFSFGSVATANDTEAPKFTFGSDKERSLSFKSVDKDAVCY